MSEQDHERARFYRKCALGVKLGAAALIFFGGVYHFSAAPSQPVSGPGLKALVSVQFDDGNRFQVSWGPDLSQAEKPGLQGAASQVEQLIPSDTETVKQAGAVDAPLALPEPNASAVIAPSMPDVVRSVSACSLQSGSGSAAVSRATMNISQGGRLDAFGVRDVGMIWEASDEAGAGYVLPVLSAIKSQGALTSLRLGRASASGPQVGGLPNTLSGVTGEDGVFALGMAHGAVDLVEVGNGSFVDELNPWYHSLNSGMRSNIIGALRCSAVQDAEVLGQTAAGPRKQSNDLTQRISSSALYVSDGSSSLQEFTVSGVGPSTQPGAEVKLDAPSSVLVTAKLKALLPHVSDRPAGYSGWGIERARYGSTQSVNVEVIVNGSVAATVPVSADNSLQTVSLQVPIERSSWVALRLMGAGHSNPVFVIVDSEPVLPSRTSIEWNQRALLQAFELQNAKWDTTEAPQATAAYRYAFARYDALLLQTEGR